MLHSLVDSAIRGICLEETDFETYSLLITKIIFIFAEKG